MIVEDIERTKVLLVQFQRTVFTVNLAKAVFLWEFHVEPLLSIVLFYTVQLFPHRPKVIEKRLRTGHAASHNIQSLFIILHTWKLLVVPIYLLVAYFLVCCNKQSYKFLIRLAIVSIRWIYRSPWHRYASIIFITIYIDTNRSLSPPSKINSLQNQII